MNVVMFYHSLVSDWNHGNAHFLRGVVTELQHRGHRVRVYEPQDNWSLQNLKREHGDGPVREFHRRYPRLQSTPYRHETLDLDATLHDAHLVLVHEWNRHALVARIGDHHRQHSHYTLLFHDTHHRCISDAQAMTRYDLSAYDGALVFGDVIRQVYLSQGWTRRAWVWHEAADASVFRPLPSPHHKDLDLVWIGNWGDEERTAELAEFLIEPVRELGLRAEIYGVRYPASAQRQLADAGIAYKGWLPNFRAPELFARARMTVHVPRRPYTQRLKGIPTIRPFEAMASGVPLISAPWQDSEHLFRPGRDYLVARDGKEMRKSMETILMNRGVTDALLRHGLQTIRRRHTCAHRVNQLLTIGAALNHRPPRPRKTTVVLPTPERNP